MLRDQDRVSTRNLAHVKENTGPVSPPCAATPFSGGLQTFLHTPQAEKGARKTSKVGGAWTATGAPDMGQLWLQAPVEWL